MCTVAGLTGRYLTKWKTCWGWAGPGGGGQGGGGGGSGGGGKEGGKGGGGNILLKLSK